MSSLVKSAVLGLGVLVGVATTAHAQSVSALPPTSPPTVSATTAPAIPSGKIFPNPGSGSTWQEQHYQPPAGYDADASQHPYSTSIGPKPGSHSSGVDQHYDATDKDTAPGMHPYSMTGVGPRTN